MKISILKALALSYCLLSEVAIAQSNDPMCTRLVVRKEIRDLNRDEWNMIRSVLQKLQEDGNWAKVARIHTENFAVGHNFAILMPFHREIVRQFEIAGQKYDPNFFVPYWDAARDFQNPAGSAVFTPDFIGGNGDPNRDSCISTGFQRDWVLQFTQPHCLRRAFNGPNNTIKPWYSPEYMSSIIQTSSSYDKFREAVELTIHGAVHLGIGAEMTTMQSPNDFAFYLHHSNLDRMWWKWQNARPENLMAYDGQKPTGGPVSLNDPNPGYPSTIVDVMKLGYRQMCYTYDDVVPLDFLVNQNPVFSGSGSGQRVNGGALMKAGKLPNFRSSVVTNQLRSLKNNTIERFFPALRNGDTNPNLFDLNFSKNEKKQKLRKRQGGPMAVPEMPPDEWIEMHKYDKNRVRSAVTRAAEFVNQLNAQGYNSPYV
ncbi:hypothetical protein BB560_001696 [Smittium megazygosporum]|uniref:Tyrosinase copper-binding domain-containing protein n=1 Tax=Smittium megazygosporum TaxID=133381 RepID=A0A2T9ZGX3_9FUNG|nr:hypothetical protein BB560_001696 [Smittium megazygosporum]